MVTDLYFKKRSLFLVVITIFGVLLLGTLVESSSSHSSLKKPPVFGVTASKSATGTDSEGKQTSATTTLSSQQNHPEHHHQSTETTDAVSTASVTTNNATTTTNATNATIIPEWKRSLPYPLNEKGGTLRRIIVPGPGGQHVTVYLLGTAHVSIDSSHDVKTLLSAIQPNVIFLEICDQRIPLLVAPGPENTSKKEEKDNNGSRTSANTTNEDESGTAPKDKSIVAKEKKNRAPWWKQLQQSETKSMYGMAATLLTSMQQDYADSLGVELGGEFRVAHDYWAEERTKNDGNRIFHLILGDRPLYLTLTRAWESLRLWGKTKLVFGLIISSFTKPNPEELREWMQSVLADDSGDLLSKSIGELRQHFPTLEEVIIRERDAYMACKLYQTCRQLMSHQYARYSGGGSHGAAMEPCTIVAIVGAGHVAGICHWLTVGNGETPEAILSRLIQTKKMIPEEDSRSLIFDVMEVNHDLLQELAKENMKSEQQQQ